MFMQHMPAAYELYWELSMEHFAEFERVANDEGVTLNSIMRWIGERRQTIFLQTFLCRHDTKNGPKNGVCACFARYMKMTHLWRECRRQLHTVKK